MKFSLVVLNKKKNAFVLNNATGIDLALMGASLVSEASKKIAKEKEITFSRAKEAVLDTIAVTEN